jgi:uncharacterized protein YdiU (UPF0061 family)
MIIIKYFCRVIQEKASGAIMFDFENTYAQLPRIFFSPAQPATFPKPELTVWNKELARQLGAKTSKYTQGHGPHIFRTT